MQPKDILTWPCTRPVLLNKSLRLLFKKRLRGERSDIKP